MSDTVALIARITARPDVVADVEATLRGLVDAAAEEDGTVEYVLSREGDSGSFWFFEVYADQAAFDEHGRNPVLHAAFASFGGLLAEPPEMHLLTPLQAKRLTL